ncbi:LysR family transcriptional regulator [Chromobacterium sphagni]|uniref:LysR family transcriptional regulator n=1 Tax=Chromobacterium sphagni TaxID=1903179 RepID=A0A1S1X1Y0_9NEIS|nr:LysR family transcriptional regulator [Chromobacterium sphagni]OHX13166.1 LysR family transcriptional regulator [Chromobacterium sphagni]
MDSLSGLLAFVRAAELGSFVAAGDRLGISASAVSKSISRLEDKLAARLFHRSTRRISLTQEGLLLFERCRRIMAELEEASAELAQNAAAPRGRLKASLPLIGHRMLSPLLPEFHARYPEIELELDFSDRMVDLVAEGFDVAVRSGELSDSRLQARLLGPFRFMLVGSPGYFHRRGLPLHPGDLLDHACLRYRFPYNGQLQLWALRHIGDVATPQLSHFLTCNSIEALVAAAADGLGIAWLPDFAVGRELADGRLLPVLENCAAEPGKFSAVWPSSRHQPPKLRVFIDFLAERLLSPAKP